MNPLLVGAVIAGAGVGLGLWLLVVRLPQSRRNTFADRIEPQLRAVTSGSRLLSQASRTGGTLAAVERSLQLLLGDSRRRSAGFSLGNVALQGRLSRAGYQSGVLHFRAEQVIFAAAGLVFALVGVLLLAINGRLNLLLSLIVILASTGLGFLFRDWLLSRRIVRRERQMLAEFPALAELMALAVAAGESVTGALERVCQSSTGPLNEEFRLILSRTRGGQPLAGALFEFSQRSRVAPLIRFTDGLAIAVERGTPLVEVLVAQAQDVRELAKRQLIETAGKKEIGMMIPLVFGILPLTVIFAAFPGLQLLTLGF